MTALTCYFTQAAASSPTTADQFATATGGTLANKTTLIGTSNSGWGELYSQGNTAAWAALGSIGNPSGHGWLLDAGTLEGQQFIAGNWTPTVRMQLGIDTTSVTGDLHVRAYRRGAGGLYTQIGTDMTKTGITISTTVTSYSPTAVSQPVMNFNLGDRLYVDVWFLITATACTLSTAQIKTFATTSATQGIATAQIVTAGYQAQAAASVITIARARRPIGRIF